MKVITKDYGSMEAFREERDSVFSSGGGMLAFSQEAFDPREQVQVDLMLHNQQIASLSAEVVYVSPKDSGWDIGLELKEAWQKQLEAVHVEETSDQAWGKDSESVFHRIQAMSLHEKIQAAVKGGKEERRILMKAAHHQVHGYLLKNPRISSEEIAEMSRSPGITTEMLMDISNNLEWMKNATIKMSVLKNPKTPQTVVKKHIQFLSETDLYLLARSDHVRESVSRMAKSVLASRGKRVD